MIDEGVHSYYEVRIAGWATPSDQLAIGVDL